jgi:predicted extracellular nuclease
MRKVLLQLIILGCASQAYGSLIISEYMYNGAAGLGEFFELTNLSSLPLDMTGYSYDDSSNLPGSFPIGAFGIVQPNESVIVTESLAANFRTAWNLPAIVKVIGGSTENLARNDQINMYDASNALVTRLTFGDQDFPGTIRTQLRSGWPQPAGIGANPINTNWVLSTVGDAQNSYTSVAPSAGDIGNPGFFVPEPSTLALLTIGAMGLIRRKGKEAN